MAVQATTRKGTALLGASSWTRLDLPAISITVILLAGLAYRLTLMLTHGGYEGVDGGAYLNSAHLVLGRGVASLDFPRPPLAPGWTLAPFITLWGDDVGFKLWNALASWALLPAFTLLASLVLTRWQTVFAAAFLSVDLLLAEMMATGSLPILGFAYLALIIWGVFKLAESERIHWPAAVTTAACVPLLAYTNETATGLGIITIPVMLLCIWRMKSAEAAWHGLRPLLIGGLLALTAYRYYVQVAPGSGLTAYGGHLIYPAMSPAILQLLLVVPVGVWALRKLTDYRLRTLAVMTLTVAALMPWFSFDETIINIFYRARYLVEIPLTILLTALVWPWLTRKDFGPVLWGGAAVVFALLSVGYAHQFHVQAALSDMVSQDGAKAISYIEAHPKPGRVITNASSLSLWVSALTRLDTRYTFAAQPPAKWASDDAAVRCLLGWEAAGCDIAASSARIQPSYLLIERRFQIKNLKSNPIPTRVYGAPITFPWDLKMPQGWQHVERVGTVDLWEWIG